MDNRKQLKILMIQHDLNNQAVADILRVQPTTVQSWKLPDTSKRHRDMPINMLELLQYKLND